MRIICRDTGETVYNYADYLKTKHWQIVREFVYSKSNGICNYCKRPLAKKFIAHHRSSGAYRRIGRERFNHKFWRDDVVAVCPLCHNGKSKQHFELHEFIKVPKWAMENHIEN